MLLGFLTVVVMLAGAYAFWRQGVLPAFAMAVNVLLAGLVAFNFFEPLAAQLASMLEGSFFFGYVDSFCLVVLFCLALGFLRWASNGLIHTLIEYNPILQQGGSVLFGLLAGYLVAGFLMCVLQMLPANEHFLDFEARVEADSGGKVRHRILPPDRVWLALMHRASVEALGWDETEFDADGSFEFRYRARRHEDPHHETHE